MDKWNPAAMKAGHDLFMASQITTCSGFAEDGSPRDAAAKFHYTAPGVGYMADFFFFAFYTHKGEIAWVDPENNVLRRDEILVEIANDRSRMTFNGVVGPWSEPNPNYVLRSAIQISELGEGQLQLPRIFNRSYKVFLVLDGKVVSQTNFTIIK